MTDWDATRYHRLSGPQVNWGRHVLARLAPRPGERILDIGSGTGRLTLEIAAAGAHVVGLDRSASMLAEAHRDGRGSRGWSPAYVQGDGALLPFASAFDAVFSTATFHWIMDHDALFAGIHGVLIPGGRLVAQAGGGPNLRRLLERTHRLMRDDEYRGSFGDWSDPWYFAWPQETRERLGRSGFVDIETSLEEAVTALETAPAYADFISCVCVRHHVDKLPPAERSAFVGELTQMAAQDDPPFTLDYWRLNIAARKAAA